MPPDSVDKRSQPACPRFDEMVTARNPVEASEPYLAAVAAVDDLLQRLRTERAFVGSVAVAAWLGRRVDRGAIDVLVALSPEGRTQVPMMASNRGFDVDRDELDATEELDLIPLRYGAANEQVKIHVLVASNALYGNMVRDAVEVPCGDVSIRVITPEDLALLLTVGEDQDSTAIRDELIRRAGESFQLDRFNHKLTSIGLAGKTINR